MISAGIRLTLVTALLCGLVTVAYAQVPETRGTVQRVDTLTRTIYFTDGRTLRLDPTTRLYVGNREVRLTDVQPGWILATAGPTVAPGTVVAQPIAPSAAPASAIATRNGSINFPYCTPEGHAVSQARQSRHNSRCRSTRGESSSRPSVTARIK